MATQLDVWFTVDFQQGSRAMVHSVKVYQNARLLAEILYEASQKVSVLP